MAIHISEDEFRSRKQKFNNRTPQPWPTPSVERAERVDDGSETRRRDLCGSDGRRYGQHHPWRPPSRNSAVPVDRRLWGEDLAVHPRRVPLVSVWALPVPPPPPPPSYLGGWKSTPFSRSGYQSETYPRYLSENCPWRQTGYRESFLPFTPPAWGQRSHPQDYNHSFRQWPFPYHLYQDLQQNRFFCPKHGLQRSQQYQRYAQPIRSFEESPYNQSELGDIPQNEEKDWKEAKDDNTSSISSTWHNNPESTPWEKKPQVENMEEPEVIHYKRDIPLSPVSNHINDFIKQKDVRSASPPQHSTPISRTLHQMHSYFQKLEQDEIVQMLRECDLRHERQMDFNRSLMEEKNLEEKSDLGDGDYESALESSDSDTEVKIYWDVQELTFDFANNSFVDFFESPLGFEYSIGEFEPCLALNIDNDNKVYSWESDSDI